MRTSRVDRQKPILRNEASGRFPAHGRFFGYPDGRNIVIEVEGPWNEELADDFWRQADALIPALDSGGPWGVTTVIHGGAVLPPDGFARFRARLEATAGSKRAAAAIVIGPEVEGFGLVEDLYLRCYAGLCPAAVFSSLSAARGWIARHVDVARVFEPVGCPG